MGLKLEKRIRPRPPESQVGNPLVFLPREASRIIYSLSTLYLHNYLFKQHLHELLTGDEDTVVLERPVLLEWAPFHRLRHVTFRQRWQQ